MLDDGDDALGLDAVAAALEAFDIGLDLRAGEIGVLAERAVDAARLGREIGLRRKRFGDADGAILLARDIAEVSRECRVADRGEAERFGPLRKPLLPALAPSVYWKWLRGSELIVTGMPSRDCSASVWIWLVDGHGVRIGTHARDVGVDAR